MSEGRPPRSYVLRQGNMTPAQRRALEMLWPKYGLAVTKDAIDPTAVFGRAAPLVMEIGFGMGQSLVAQAQAFPDVNFIGVEVHAPGVGACLHALEKAQLCNLRIYHADSWEVLTRCISDQALDRVQVFFPDPWPKRRHHKRRLIQPAFIALIKQKLAPHGILHLATDWEDYAKHMRKVLEASELTNVAGVGNYHARPSERPLTKYEQRGQSLGHPVFDLVFVKQDCRPLTN